MKIGIITLSASDNCGSLLQSYALKKLLERYGEVEIINFSSESSHCMYDIPAYKGVEFLKKYRKIKFLRKAKADYNFFRRQYLEIIGREYFQDDLMGLSQKYDVVVTGSDQVWNVQMSDYDDAFFLGWFAGKKVAYAPSLGGRHLNLSGNYKKIKEWLKDFDYISVREGVGKECLEEVTGRVVPKTLDPTLVLDEKQWNDMVGEPLIKGEYIFYYSWAYCEDATSKIVADESDRTGLPVYVIDPRKWVHRDYKKWGFHLYNSTGPLIFLNLMKHATKCYVESFHGMVFAYIFKKNYWLLDTHENYNDLDSRLMEFVELLGAQDRILTEYNVDNIDQGKKIDYGTNLLLKELREKSWEFLDSAFVGEK